MAIKTNILGMNWKYPDYYVVEREKIREFAKAVKSEDPASYDEAAARALGHDGLVAPLTFSAIFAKLVQADFFRNVDTGYTTMQMVQVDQSFIYHRPVKDGDRLSAEMEIISVNERFGADIVTTRNICTDQNGEVVLEAFTTMMGHEGDDSVNLKWDEATGQVVRKS